MLHGGATVALAESVGSAVSYMSVDYINQTVRGIIISANHLKSIKKLIPNYMLVLFKIIIRS